MTIVQDVLARWADEKPTYEVYRAVIQEDLARLLRGAGIPIERLSVRLKDTDSLAKKVLRKDYERYEQITDKLGVRIVVRVPSDVDRVVNTVRGSYGGEVQDKRTAKSVDSFAYRSVHIQVHGAPNREDLSRLECEIQVRTICEDAWASLEHFLNYKPAGSATSYEHQRSLFALAAVLELADGRFEQIFDAMVTSPDFLPTAILNEIEAPFLQLGGANFDRKLSYEVIEALVPAYQGLTPQVIRARLDAWLLQTKEWFPRQLNGLRADDQSSVFLGQPELLLLLELMAARSTSLVRCWTAFFELEELETLANVFGYDLGTD